MTLANVLTSVGIVWYASIGLISIGGWLCLLFVYNRSELEVEGAQKHSDATPLTRSTAETLHGVSILRPMSGLDPDLFACLESSFKQDYPTFEVILSVKSGQDPAVDVARRVMSKYPTVDAQLIIGDTEVGVNPKINNLIQSYERSKYPIIWILDSNSWTSRSTLARSMTHFDSAKTNLVHHIPVAHASRNAQVGALLDDVYMGTMHAKMYAIINYLSVAPCVMGKSNIIRKSALPENGLAAFGKYIAEDHLLAVSIWTGRGSHVLAADCVRQPLLEVSGRQYCLRRIRWVRVRKYMTTAATLVEPCTEAFLLGLIGALSLRRILSIEWWKIWLLHIFFWSFMDFICWNRIRNHPHDEAPVFETTGNTDSTMGLLTWAAMWFCRESSAFPLWCVAMSRDRIYWRGSQFVINRDMTARRVEG